MSLINEALKRAKQVPPPTPASSAPPPFRPAEPAARPWPLIRWLLPVLVVLAGGLLLVTLWQLQRLQKPGPVQGVNSADLSQESPPETIMPTATLVRARSSQPLTNLVLPSRSREATDSPASEHSGPGNLAAQSTNSQLSIQPSLAPTPETQQTNLVAEPPKPPAPRLQGIVFNPRRPSALVNGRTLFIGDKFGEFRVTAIRQDSVKLVSATQTNILSLDQ